MGAGGCPVQNTAVLCGRTPTFLWKTFNAPRYHHDLRLWGLNWFLVFISSWTRLSFFMTFCLQPYFLLLQPSRFTALAVAGSLSSLGSIFWIGFEHKRNLEAKQQEVAEKNISTKFTSLVSNRAYTGWKKRLSRWRKTLLIVRRNSWLVSITKTFT